MAAFDISVLKPRFDRVVGVNTGGDSAFGGDDFDHRILLVIDIAGKLQPFRQKMRVWS